MKYVLICLLVLFSTPIFANSQPGSLSIFDKVRPFFQYSNPFIGYVFPKNEFDNGAEFGIKSGYHFNETYALEYGLGVMPTLVNTHESETLTLITYSLEGKRYYTYQSFLESFDNVHSFASLGFFGNFSGKQEFVQIRLGLGMDVDISENKQLVFHFIVGNDVALRIGVKQSF